LIGRKGLEKPTKENELVGGIHSPAADMRKKEKKENELFRKIQ
jgi:hypothetical protein